MESVFVYFFAIGSGIAVGLTIGSIPAVLIYRYIKKREGINHAYKTTKARARS